MNDEIEKALAEMEEYARGHVYSGDDYMVHAGRIEQRLIAALRHAHIELRNIATRGNNCECASHGWAKAALASILAALRGEVP